MDSELELWNSVLSYLKDNRLISNTALDMWFSKIEFLGFKDGLAQLKFNNSFHKDTVIQQFGSVIEDTFSNICGFPVIVVYLSKDDLMSKEEKKKKDLTDLKLDKFTFDNFIVGDSNELAYSAAKAVAGDPGGQINKSSGYNPLFIYGNSGLGKTHLLKAIKYEINQNYPEMKVLYITSNDFLNEFINCVKNGTYDEFREKYRKVDALLIDDIQFIAGKHQTEEEFFHTFDALRDAGHQIVLTSDRLPKDIPSLVERLQTRFSGGLLADIQPPEYETRCAIIKRKAELDNYELDDAIVTYVAEKIKSNIRDLEGITKKIHALSLFGRRPINIALANEAIKEVQNDVQPLPITIENIVNEVSRTTGISSEDIYGKGKSNDISNARKMCFYIIREVTDMSYKNIGKEFNRDHSTVMYNVEKMRERIKEDNSLYNTVSDIINNIKNNR